MPRPIKLLVYLGLLLLGRSTAIAQEGAWIEVESNATEATLYADSVLLGQVSEGVFAVPAGEINLTLVAPESASWSIEAVRRDVVASAGDTTAVELRFPYHYRVESIPYGAQVFVGASEERRLLGSTPLTFTTDEPLTSDIAVEKAGYLTEQIEPGDALWNRSAVTLDPTDVRVDRTKSAEVAWSPPRPRSSRWIDYGAVALAAASAVVSVHYKFKADDLYERYERTGDPDLRQQIRSLDTRAAVALGAMQLGVGVFAIRLALK